VAKIAASPTPQRPAFKRHHGGKARPVRDAPVWRGSDGFALKVGQKIAPPNAFSQLLLNKTSLQPTYYLRQQLLIM
jgi:hypothetical protein